MDNIYIIMASQGIYDDYTTRPVRCYFVRADAEAAVIKAQEDDRIYNELTQAAREQLQQWSTLPENRRPTLEHLERVPPATQSKKGNAEKHAAEQQVIRAVIKKNDETAARNLVVEKAWFEKAISKSHEIMSSLGVKPEDMENFLHPIWSSYPREYEYDIEELEVL